MIYTIKTTVGRENAVVTALANRVQKLGIDVKAIFHPSELRGYIFIEIGEGVAIETLLRGIPHIKGIIKKPVKIEEIKHFLEAKAPEIKISRGDIVEIIGGPFKGERGKVIRVDEAKEEVTVEFLDVAVPIPTTISIDNVRLVEKFEKEKKEEG
ncbi:MAG TPA: transcription elongation factor Spt5 [Nanoarchaeota archaeon]|nr:transcription elongation factor Spt5 [Nanoarchaeota archaeon]